MSDDQWREQLRVAIDRTNKKHSWIAEQAGIAPGTLSRILTGKHCDPSFEVVMRIAMRARRRLGGLPESRSTCSLSKIGDA